MPDKIVNHFVLADGSTAKYDAGSLVNLDETVSLAGYAPDAKAVGDAISEQDSKLDAVSELVVSPNLLNFNDPDFLYGKYIDNRTGTLYNSGTYNTSGYIPVEEGKTYIWTYGVPVGSTRAMRFVCAFDNEKNVLGSLGGENKNSYTVPSGVSFIRFSGYAQYFKPAQSNIMFGVSPIEQYTEYLEPYYIIKNSALDVDYLNGLINAKIVNTVTDYGLSVTAKVDNLSPSDTLTVIQNIDNKKNAVIEFWGSFESFTSLTLGHGDHILYGNFIVIDETHLTDYYGNTPQQMAQVEHGLTISDFIHVVITQNNGARAKVQIITASGDYTLSDCSWDGCRGNIFAKVGANMTDCVCNAIFKDFNEKVFLFGDSYVGLDPARYPYYLVNNGYTHFLLDGWGGRTSAQALVSFNNVIDKTIPKYAIWALGMNDQDTSTAVNASWLSSINTFLNACESNGITPILATIPNCPNQLNTFKNTWVKESGHRFVDFAKAVGAESAGSGWYEGMLSTDNVHPTALGAKALYSRILSDVPELVK